MMKPIQLLAVFAVAFQLPSFLAAQGAFEVGEIAPYTIVKEAKNYEIRSYAPANWVCRDHTGDNFRNRDQAMSFFDLFDYITGQNSAETDIKMTAPVTVHTQNNFDAQGNSQYKMCFYLPAIHQANPPSPKNSAVYIENRPALILAARRFGGFVKGQRDWNEHKEALKADMKADNELDFDFDNFYGASYDSPYTFKDRRNEVWVAKLQ
ncbi:heme-binding protein 2-like [Palaemon carinicauda]|uniref:heme-binding protein 2-like n=1 Tax=Palaemon carinicauda TaxID=392227 RepID=UPI0035B6245C